MPFVPGKCPICGEDIYVSTEKDHSFCTSCGAKFITQAAISFSGQINDTRAVPNSAAVKEGEQSDTSSRFLEFLEYNASRMSSLGAKRAGWYCSEGELKRLEVNESDAPYDLFDDADREIGFCTTVDGESVDCYYSPNDALEYSEQELTRYIDPAGMHTEELSEDRTATTFLDQWKTSIGASVGGVAVNLVLINLPWLCFDEALSWHFETHLAAFWNYAIAALIFLTMFYCFAAVWCFTSPPLRFESDYQGSNRAVSFANCFFGSWFFGPLWNSNLTKKDAGQISHIVAGIMWVIFVIYCAYLWIILLTVYY